MAEHHSLVPASVNNAISSKYQPCRKSPINDNIIYTAARATSNKQPHCHMDWTWQYNTCPHTPRHFLIMAAATECVVCLLAKRWRSVYRCLVLIRFDIGLYVLSVHRWLRNRWSSYQLPIFSFSPGEGKKSVEKVLNCISLWYIYIHPVSMPISKCLILKK